MSNPSIFPGRISTAPRKFSLISISALILAFLFTILHLFRSTTFDPLELKLYDESMNFASTAGESTPSVVLIEIDEKSSQTLGTWPWPRQALAEMVNFLSSRGAKVIGLCVPLGGRDTNRALKELRGFREKFDVYSSSKKDEGLRSWVLEELKQVEEKLDADRILADKVRQAGNVVVPVFIGPGSTDAAFVQERDRLLPKSSIPDRGIPLPAETLSGSRVSLPFAELSEAVLGVGHTGLSPKSGMQGRSHPPFMPLGGSLLPSFPFRVALAFLNIDPKQVIAGQYQIGVRGFSIPLWKGEMLVNFRSAAPLPRYSFADVLQDKGFPESLKGKIVLIGLNLAESMKIATPLSPAMPVIEFHARVIQSFLAKDFIARPFYMVYIEAALAWIIGFFAALYAARMGRLKTITATLCLLVAVLGIGFALFSYGLWVKSGSLAAYIAVLFFVVTLLHPSRAENTPRFSAETGPMPEMDLQDQAPPEEVTASGEVAEGGEPQTIQEDSAEVLKRIGRYDILQELGRGSMGLIYKALDPKINRLVAIKTIRFSDEFDPEVAQEIKARFFQEAEIAGRLSHPSIVAIHDVGEDQGLTYMAMEFLEGDDLERYITKGGRLPLRRILEIVANVADALEFAHKAGVIHRDIKPANIMLLKQGGVKVTDFGIAKAISSSRTKTGVILGTPNYMSPEQIMGQRIDYRSDIFSLGVLFYQLMSGELPFHGDNLSSLLYEITQVKHPPLRTLEPKVPKACEQIVDKALAKNPQHRFHSAGEMARLARLILSKMDEMRKQ